MKKKKPGAITRLLKIMKPQFCEYCQLFLEEKFRISARPCNILYISEYAHLLLRFNYTKTGRNYSSLSKSFTPGCLRISFEQCTPTWREFLKSRLLTLYWWYLTSAWNRDGTVLVKLNAVLTNIPKNRIRNFIWQIIIIIKTLIII